MRARVARALLAFAHHLGEEVELGRLRIRHKITQSDLAAMAGVARESVSRTLAAGAGRRSSKASRGGYVVHEARLKRARRR